MMYIQVYTFFCSLILIMKAKSVASLFENTSSKFNISYLDLSNVVARSEYAILVIGNRLIDFKRALLLFQTVIKQQTNCDFIVIDFSTYSSKNPYDMTMSSKFINKNVTVINASTPVKKTDIASKSYAKILGRRDWHFIKFLLWQFTMYKKIMFLDVDMMIVKDINHMFEIDADFVYCNGTASPLNSGMLVIRPSLTTYSDMIYKVLEGNFTKSEGWDRTGIRWVHK